MLELLDTAAQFAHERRQIAEVLDNTLPVTVGELRAALNRLYAIVS